MPLTLYRYILRELLKLLTVSTAVLVVLMSFGSAIKPISDGLLGPGQVVKVVLYTMPGMLTFALPFAAAFSATLVFFRMSSDNEVTACAVSGVSYRELLTPVFVLGLVLTLSIFVLSNWVVPRFWRLVEQEVEKDIAQMVTRQISRGQVVEMGRLILYADRAREGVPIEARPAGRPRPYNRLVLEGVAVGKMARGKGTLEADYTAERATVDLYRDPSQNRIFATAMLRNVTINDPQSGTFLSVRRQPVQAQEIPSPFKQEPKFLSLDQLRQFAREPRLSATVREAKQALCEALAGQRLLQALHERLEASPNDSLLLRGPRGRDYRVRSPAWALRPDALELQAEGSQQVEVRRRREGLITRRFEASGGRLKLAGDTVGEEPRLNLILDDVYVSGPELPTPARLKTLTLPLLSYDEPVLAPLQDTRVREVLRMAREHQTSAEAGQVEAVERTRARLAGEVGTLMRQIASRLHERAAVAINCVLVLLLGAVMSMRLRRQMPLTIFFWCFVPTVIAFLAITSGQSMMEWPELSLGLGMAMIWSGNALLLALGLGVYLNLRRN